MAFVGRQAAFGRALPHAPAPGLQPRVFDTLGSAGADPAELVAALSDWAPHVMVFLGPPWLAVDVMREVEGVKLGVIADSGDAADLNRFDRVVCVDPQVAAAVDHTAPVWRTLPLPVDDSLYAEVRPPAAAPRALFLGASTDHRERFLIGAKHEYDLLHYAHGLQGDELRDVLARTDVGVNIDGEPFPGCGTTALLHLAAGQLLVSQPLHPSIGLEPGADFVEVTRPDQLLTVLYQLQRRPETYDRIRLRGRAKAEEHRASRVWPRVVGDLLADVAAFG